MRLKFKTTPPKAGCVEYTGHSTHTIDWGEKLPTFENAGLTIVNNAMRELLRKLDALGYDMTSASFSIKVKDEHCKKVKG